MFVQLVIAAMTTAPWSSFETSKPAEDELLDDACGRFFFAGEADWIASSDFCQTGFICESATRSCGRFGPARLGSTVERSSSIVELYCGSDPAAVAYDACEAAVARGADFVILDTAGRLHTQKHLMDELGKIRSVVAKKIPGGPHEVILVIDGTTGQNAIMQAKVFTEVIQVTGIFLAKLDGTARGGIVIAIREMLNIPVKFVGLGEKPEDIAEFDPDGFVEALFN